MLPTLILRGFAILMPIGTVVGCGSFILALLFSPETRGKVGAGRRAGLNLLWPTARFAKVQSRRVLPVAPRLREGPLD